MTDHLLERLRAADPARDGGGDVPSAAAVRSLAGRRRARRTGAGAGALAVLATAVTALAPAGGPGAGQVAARAAAAAAAQPGTIAMVESAVSWTSNGSAPEAQRRTVWVRTGTGGRTLGVRMVTAGEGEEVTTVEDGQPTTVRRNPDGTTDTAPGMMIVPGIVFSARELLDAARRGDGRPRLDGEETVGDRQAYRLVVTGVAEPERPGDVEVLLIDKETYEPLAHRVHSEGTDVQGKPYTYDLTERVVATDEVPDTPGNRHLVTLGG